MSFYQNTSSTFLRTQSHLVNGQPNPNKLLSNISRKKYFSNFIKFYSKKQKKTKISLTNKQYINEIKQQKQNTKSSSLNKYNNNIKKALKQKKINPLTENEKIINKEEINLNKVSNQTSNNSIKNKENDCNIININNNKVKKDNEFNIDKNKTINDNKYSDKSNNISLYSINTFTNKYNKYNKYNNFKKNYSKKSNFTTSVIENEKNSHKEDILNIIYDNHIFSNTKKYNYNSKHKDFEYSKSNTFNLSNSRKSIKSKKKGLSLQKDKSFINKILLKNDTEIDEYINKIKSKNKLLDQLNYYTKREKNYIQNSDFVEENKTKAKIMSMKRSINKISINTNPESNSKEKYQISKINEFKKQNSYHNFYNNSNKSIKNHVRFINSLNKANYYFNRNNDMTPMLTDYNVNNDKVLFKPKIFKETIKRTFSNALFAMRDERNTNNFIKELNKSNKNYNSNKVIPFSFNKENSEEFNNNLFKSTLKKNGSSLLLGDKGSKINTFYKNNDYSYYKTNNIFKKNSSFDNFRKHSTRKSFQSNFNIVNNKLFNYINDINNNSILIMPVNQAD